jgi:hypothetical protein
MAAVTFRADIRTTNPNNGAQGITRGAMFARAKIRKQQRELLGLMTKAYVREVIFPVVVTLTRIAPSNGLDPHDGLPSSMKGICDGVCDGLGIKNDRDERITWRFAQRRGRPREYAVEVRIDEAGEQ